MVKNHSTRRSRILIQATLSIFSLTSIAAGGSPSFQGLGELPGGGTNSVANAVSADGITVVGRSSASGGTRAFRWTATTGMQNLGVLSGGSNSEAEDVSADGRVIVGHSSGKSWIWTPTTGLSEIGVLPGATGTFSEAHAVSADGRVVVGRSDSSSAMFYEAFRWEDANGNGFVDTGEMIGLGFLPNGDNRETFAFGVNANGSRVVGLGSVSGSGGDPFLWTIGVGMVSLGDLSSSSTSTWALDISPEGSVVVGRGEYDSATSRSQAFLWEDLNGNGSGDPGEILGLGDFAGGGNVNSEALAVSANGKIVVGRGEDADGWLAFIWDPINGFRSLQTVLTTEYGLDLTGWRLEAANDITPDGTTIVGFGTNPQGTSEAWIVRLPKPCETGDVNEDGVVDGNDVAGFVQKLLGS